MIEISKNMMPIISIPNPIKESSENIAVGENTIRAIPRTPSTQILVNG